MWTRAVWLEDNEEQEGVIPQTWIHNQMVHWPPGVNAARAMDEMRDPTPSWRKFTLVKVKVASDDRTVCEECNTTTTAELSDEEEENVKRRKKKKIFEDFYVADDCNDRIQENEKKCAASLPKPPEKFVGKQSYTQPTRTHQERQASSDMIPIRTSPRKKPQLTQQKKSPQKRRTQVLPTRTSPRKRVMDSSQKGIQHSQTLPGSSLELSGVSLGAGPSSQGTSHGMDTDDKFPMSDGKFQKKVLFILSSMWDGIKQIQHKINQSNNDSEVKFEIKRMNSIAEVQENEQFLQDPERLKHAVSQLSRIGGISMKDAVAQAMQRVLTNEVMAHMNMKGKRGKYGFEQTLLFRVIRESVLTHQSGTESIVAEAVAKCLKYAPDRMGGGGRKVSSEDSPGMSASLGSSDPPGPCSSVSKSEHSTATTKKRKLVHEEVSPVSSNSTGTTVLLPLEIDVEDEMSSESSLM